jgi:hypothetical protein
MRSLLSLVALAAIVCGVYHFYGHSFDPKPVIDRLSATPVLNPELPEIQDTARAINHVEDGANAKIQDAKNLKDEVARKANEAGLGKTEKKTTN